MMRAARAAVKDKTYQHSPVGREVGRFLNELRFAGSPKTTRDTYELPLALLSLEHDDFAALERFAAPDGPEYLLDFLTRHWGECAPATRQNRLAAVRSFFRWAHESGRISRNPALILRGPRVKNRERRAHGRDELVHLIAAQESLRDQCALGLFARLALRKNELRLLRIGDIDLSRNLVSILHGKGADVAILPLGFQDLRADLYLHIVGDSREDDEYLLYPKTHRARPMDPASVHRWFKRCLERAGLSDFPLHELRHSAGDALWRATGNIVLAQQLLRHKSVGTTQRYLHPTREDLLAGMRVLEGSEEPA
ncbi:MAG: tyrosine-type recombinase/integrase [Haloechinothrix sp.]